jgi:hypothetical protein
MNIYVTRGGQKFGPYTPEQVSAYLASGHLHPEDLAWRDGASVWKPLSQLNAVVEPSRTATKTNPFSSFERASAAKGYKKLWLIAAAIVLIVIPLVLIVELRSIAENDRAAGEKKTAHLRAPVSYSELKPYFTGKGKKWRNIVIPAQVGQERLIHFAKQLHKENPTDSFHIFDNDSQFEQYMNWDVHYPNKAHPLPEEWAEKHHVGNITLMLNRATNQVEWQLTDPFGTRIDKLEYGK